MNAVTDASPSAVDPLHAFAKEGTSRLRKSAPLKAFGRSLTLVERLRRPHYVQQPVFEPAEVAALVKYASERGIDTDDHLLRRLYRALNEYNENPRAELAMIVDGVQQPMPYAEVILREYSRLTTLTGGVSGRNLLYGRHLLRETRSFVAVTLLIFAASIGALAYGAWVADAPPSGDAILPPWVAHTIQYFAPFAWGALGSCVYILKRISDEAAANRFDPDRFQGWQTRALLGAVLGATITYLIDPATFGSATLSTTAMAFAAGLATKIIYGGVERTIDLLSEKLNLGPGAPMKTARNAVPEFLAHEIGNTDPRLDPAKYHVLMQLLDSHSRPQ